MTVAKEMANTIRKTLRERWGIRWTAMGQLTEALIAQEVLHIILGAPNMVDLVEIQELAREVLKEFEAEGA